MSGLPNGFYQTKRKRQDFAFATKAKIGSSGAAGPAVSLITGEVLNRRLVKPRKLTKAEKSQMSADKTKPKRKRGKVPRARARLDDRSFRLPSPAQVRAAMTDAGGWSAAQLAEWGVQWPPLIGWRAWLAAAWQDYGNGVIHDTVFDQDYQDKWLQMESGQRVPLVNVRERV